MVEKEFNLITEKSRRVPATSLLPEEAVMELAKALASPQDVRSDEELSVDLGIPLSHITKLKSTPTFFEPVLSNFKRNLQTIAPDIIKGLYRQFKGGSGPASKLLLEATGLISGAGAKVQVNVGTGSTVDDAIAKMSDDDLDREAHRLLMETYPDDVVYSGGKVSPAEVVDVEVEEVTGSESVPVGLRADDKSVGTEDGGGIGSDGQDELTVD